MKNRLLNMCLDTESNTLFAADTSGHAFQLDFNFNVLKISKLHPRSSHFSMIALNEQNEKKTILARSVAGHVLEYDRNTLEQLQFIDIGSFTAELDSEPIPSASHGLQVIGSECYVANSYGDLIILDAANLDFKACVPTATKTFFECILPYSGQRFLVSDCVGNVSLFNRETLQFEKSWRLDHGPIHKMVYDPVFARYWMTCDGHQGVLLMAGDLQSWLRIQVTTDDVEWIATTSDFSLFYVACFDHYIYEFENKKIPVLRRKIGPFKFQVVKVEVLSEKTQFALLESGEIVRVEENKLHQSQNFGSDCIWDLKVNADGDGVCATESGSLVCVKFDLKKPFQIIKNSEFNFGLGRIRRISILSEGNIIACTTKGFVFRATKTGNVIWQTELKGMLRECAVDLHRETIYVVSEQGTLSKLALNTGEVLAEYQSNFPLWCVHLHTKNCLLVAERSLNYGDDTSLSTPSRGALLILNPDSFILENKLPTIGNIKRIRSINDSTVTLTGNGQIGAQIFDVKTLETVKKWDAWQLNTCEDAVFYNGFVYTITYGYQLNTYKLEGDIVDSQFSVDDLPKCMGMIDCASGRYLFVTGRGRFISLYGIDETGVPKLARTYYL